MARQKKSKQTKPQRLRVWVVLPLVVLVGAVGGLGWTWAASLTCTRIDVAGAQYATPEEVRELAGVDTGAVLFDIDPVLVADRVQRHPWVAEASVYRLPTGTLAIRVKERHPVALALDEQGRPAHYLDAEGYRMPAVAGAVYDVPLLRGLRETYHPMKPVEHAAIRAVLPVLAGLDPTTNALIAELAVRDGEVWVHTTPLPERGSVPVRLGTDDFAPKLRRLSAFWQQAVVPRPDTRFRLIDLRFDSQIVTQEE